MMRMGGRLGHTGPCWPGCGKEFGFSSKQKEELRKALDEKGTWPDLCCERISLAAERRTVRDWG
jgi:hypothetical protein